MLHLICALKCEARPLIHHFQLQHVADANIFPCYLDRNTGLTLTVSGPGKIQAAAATSYTCEYFKCLKSDGWLNIGIAGHQLLDIGHPVLAHKILDAGSGQSWFPQIIFSPSCETRIIKTIDKPSTDYEESVFDMEAAGFYAIASRVGTSELVHVLKIISDNAAHPAEKLDEKFFTGLIENQLDTVDQLINQIMPLSSELEKLHKPPRYFEDCIKRWHFSQYEQHALTRILNRWQILKPDQNPLENVLAVKNGKGFLTLLEQELNSSLINY